MALLVAALAGAFDPIKIALSLMIVLSTRDARWLPSTLLAIYILLYVVFGLPADPRPRQYQDWFTGQMLSIVLLLGIWLAVTYKFGRKVATLSGTVAALASAVLIYFVVIQSNTDAHEHIEPSLDQPTRPIVTMPAPPLPGGLFGIRPPDDDEYTNIDPRLAAGLMPYDAKALDRATEDGAYRTVTLQEIDPAYQMDADIRREAEGGWFRGMGPISEIAKIGGSVADQFMGGGNLAHDIWQYTNRKFSSGPRDLTFNPEAFVAAHAGEIQPEQAWQWYGAINETEALRMLADDQDQRRRQAILVKRWSHSVTPSNY